MSTFRPYGAWVLLAPVIYKHSAPTELEFQNAQTPRYNDVGATSSVI